MLDPASGISMWTETSQVGVMTDQTGQLQCNNNKITLNCPPFLNNWGHVDRLRTRGFMQKAFFKRHTSTGRGLFHSQAVVLLKFLGRSSLQEQGPLVIQICNRQGILKRRRPHFRLMCVAQKKNFRELKQQPFLIHERHGWPGRTGSRKRFTRQMQIIKQTNVKPSRMPTE